MSKTIRELGSAIDPSRKYGVIYSIYDPPDPKTGKQAGIIPHGTTTAFGWKFGVAWRYTVLEAELVVKAINSVFDPEDAESMYRMSFCGAMSVKIEKAEEAMLKAVAKISPAFLRRMEAAKRNRGKTLLQRIQEHGTANLQ